jgi:hypothetical protein
MNHPHQDVQVARTQVKFSTSNKLLVYKTILKPIWTYEIQLWGMASSSNIEILEHLQSKAFRMIVDEIRRYGSQYSEHPNDLTVNLTHQTTGDCEDTSQMIRLAES